MFVAVWDLKAPVLIGQYMQHLGGIINLEWNIG